MLHTQLFERLFIIDGNLNSER